MDMEIVLCCYGFLLGQSMEALKFILGYHIKQRIKIICYSGGGWSNVFPVKNQLMFLYTADFSCTLSSSSISFKTASAI